MHAPARIAGSGGSRSIPSAWTLLASLLAALACAAPASAADAAGVIVRYKPGTDAAARLDTRRDAGVTRQEGMLLSRAEVVDPGAGESVADAVRTLDADPDVAFAEPNGTRHALATPSDPLFAQQWGLANTGQNVARSDPRNVATGLAGADIHAQAAWDVTTGSPDVPIAVVDSGVDFTNPDLSAGQWANPGETGTDAQGRNRATNGVDDDSDGVVDDAHGWDFVSNDNAPADLNGHGTHVSGIVGARGGDDAFGVTGVNWHSTIVPVRVLDATGSGTDANVVNGEIYAANHARVVNMSFGAGIPLQAERDAIKSHPGTLFVVAAGNDGANNDAVGDFPCNYDLPNILCVAASDRTDTLAWFSDFGASTVDLAAPGEDIVSTWPAALPPTTPVVLGDNRWAIESGTSMATPMVAGVAGLVLAHHPTLTEDQLRQSITDGVDKLPAFNGLTVTGGRLDAAGALTASDRIVSPPPPPPPPPPPAPTPVTIASTKPAPDVLAPVLSLTVARSGSLRTALRRGLAVRAHCSEGCTLSYTLLLDAATARRLHLLRAISRDTGRLTRAATDTGLLRLKLPKRARRSHRLRLTLRVRARDAAGNAVTRTVTIVLR